MKSLTEIANLFDDTKWGQDFNRTEVEVIARYLSLHTYEDQEQIFRQGEREQYMAFIVDGKVDIAKESADLTEKIIVTLSPRTHFGEMAFIDDEPRSASAVANGDVTMLVLSRENFEAIVQNHPAIGIKMLRNIARLISQRLRSTTGKLVFTRM